MIVNNTLQSINNQSTAITTVTQKSNIHKVEFKESRSGILFKDGHSEWLEKISDLLEVLQQECFPEENQVSTMLMIQLGTKHELSTMSGEQLQECIQNSTGKENPRFVHLAHLNFLALDLHRQAGR